MKKKFNLCYRKPSGKIYSFLPAEDVAGMLANYSAVWGIASIPMPTCCLWVPAHHILPVLEANTTAHRYGDLSTHLLS